MHANAVVFFGGIPICGFPCVDKYRRVVSVTSGRICVAIRLVPTTQCSECAALTDAQTGLRVGENTVVAKDRVGPCGIGG